MALRFLFIGDVVGKTGRIMFQKYADKLKREHRIDSIIVNGENSGPKGRGITSKIMRFFKHNSVDIVTSGNHIWYQNEIYPYLNQHKDLLRPANYPTGAPGVGVTTYQCNGYEVGVMNIQGRTFMREMVDCPFRTATSLLTYLHSKTKLIFVDMHAETTSEKMAFAFHLEGKVTGVVGTHTHIQTADERILPGGTAYITDLGMTGSLNSMLGMKKEPILQSFITQLPVKFSVDTASPLVMSGVIIEADPISGKALSIERVRITDTELIVPDDDRDE